MHGVYVVPSGGGWWWPSSGNAKDRDGDRHYEPTFDYLVKWLTDFRIGNGIQVGNPAEDIRAFHQHIPSKLEAQPSPTISPPKNFRERVTQWLANRLQSTQQGSLEYVPEEEANRRAEICANCPQNQNWKIGCPPCVDNAERIIAMITKGHSVNKSLQACAIAGHSNEAAVMLDEKFLKHRTNYKEELPGFCWMKEL